MQAGFLSATLHVPTGLVEVLQLAATELLILVALGRAAGRGFGVAAAAGAFLSFWVAGGMGIPAAVALVAVMAWASGAKAGRSFRQPPWAFLREMAFVLVGLGIYEAARTMASPGAEGAQANARRVIDFEGHLGLFFEPRLQELLTRSSGVTRVFNTFYSFGFLAVIAGVLVWLFLVDRPNYRLFRNCLGISAALAVATLTLFPVAPPRLVAEIGVADTVVVMGREHGFLNDYAAVPSLHVGWMVLAALVLARSSRGWAGAALGAALALGMAVTVIATGNHYWLDGVVGAVFTVAPALVLGGYARDLRKAAKRPGWLPPMRTFRREWHARRMVLEPLGTAKARLTTLSMTALLAYLVAGQVVAPGFTDFWGYLVFQMATTLLLLLAGEILFRRTGGLAWQTHLIAVFVGYADTLGTAGDLYANIAEYDKITHFLGVAAITSGAYDCFRALSGPGPKGRLADNRFLAAVAVGMVAGLGWEVYEFMGDKVFHSARVQGREDTPFDLVFDTLGAVTAGFGLRWIDRAAREREPEVAWP